jgi:hypothetical protein
VRNCCFALGTIETEEAKEKLVYNIEIRGEK